MFPECFLQVTNEEPTGFKSNLLRVHGAYSDAFFEASASPGPLRRIVFGLCFFHASVVARKKFGPQGWSHHYAFSPADLQMAVSAAVAALEHQHTAKVAWAELSFMVGEVVYGGHVTDNLDRQVVNAYLATFLRDELLDEMPLCVGFSTTPANGRTTMEAYRQHIHDALPPESPLLLAMPPSAETALLLDEADQLFAAVLLMQPLQIADSVARKLLPRGQQVKEAVSEMMDQFPERFDIGDLRTRVEDVTPYVTVVFQECGAMNALLATMHTSIDDLLKGLKGELMMSPAMDVMLDAIHVSKVPASWTAVAYPSNRPLALWFAGAYIHHEVTSSHHESTSSHHESTSHQHESVNKVPARWTAVAYPSNRPLTLWFAGMNTPHSTMNPPHHESISVRRKSTN
jgi:dynein heavy chain